jgi:hypothetical protein
VVNFIIHNPFVTNFTVLRRTVELRATGIRIELHIFLYNKTAAMKCSLSSTKWSVVFASITLLLELFVNCWESKDRTSVGETVSGSMKAM